MRPLAGAYIDVWHCNAEGAYSNERAEGTLGRKFLRGCQKTDADEGAGYSWTMAIGLAGLPAGA